MDWIYILATLYLMAVSTRQSIRRRGEVRSALAVLAWVLLPSLLAALLVYDGQVFGPFDDSLPINSDPSSWWVIPFTVQAGETLNINVIAAVMAFALLYCLVGLLTALISYRYKKRTGSGLLAIHTALIRWAIVLVGFCVVMRIQVWPILLGMGAASVVVGFALKEMLENLFTGMALDREGVFNQGDWIRIGEGPPMGMVYERNWRSTKIATPERTTVTIPNRILGTGLVTTFNKPDPAFIVKLRVSASYDDPPMKVKETLRSVLIQEPRVAQDPPPFVHLVKYEESSILYEMRFCLNDYSRLLQSTDAILTQVWYVFKSAGIAIPFPTRTVQNKHWDQVQEDTERTQKEIRDRKSLFESLPYFGKTLSAFHLDFLARNADQSLYERDTPIVRRGETGASVFFVAHGTCLVHLPDGRKQELGTGQYFGEMGLLDRERRQADVVAGPQGATLLKVEKPCMDLLFRAYPELLEEFTQVRDVRKTELPPEPLSQPELKPPFWTRLGRVAAGILRPW